MKTILFFIYKLIFLLTFFSLFLNHIINFQSKYFKFASSDLINKYNLGWSYYFMIIVEFISLFIFIFPSNHFFHKLFDYVIIIYATFISFCLINLYKITNGCIDCHYIANIFFGNYIVTIILIYISIVLYFYVTKHTK